MLKIIPCRLAINSKEGTPSVIRTFSFLGGLMLVSILCPLWEAENPGVRNRVAN